MAILLGTHKRRMQVRTVIGYKVQDNTNASPMRGLNQFLEIVQSSQAGIDRTIVRRIVAVVGGRAIAFGFGRWYNGSPINVGKGRARCQKYWFRK